MGDRRVHFSRDFSFDNLDGLTDYVEQNPQIGVLVIDSLSRYTVGKDLTKREEIYPPLVKFVDWCEKHQIAAIILHHETKPNENKKGANKMAGCSDLQRPVEGMYRLEDTKNGLMLICEEGRNLPKADWLIERNTNPSDCGYFFKVVGNERVDKPKTKKTVGEQIVEFLEKESGFVTDSSYTVDDIANALGLNKSTVQKELSQGLPNIKEGHKKGRCYTYLFDPDPVADLVSQ